MNAPHVAEASRDYLTQLAPPLVSHFDLLAVAPQGVARLRELILSLAVRGKLVPQDAADEPARVLLERVRAEKDRLIAEGKIKRDKPLATIKEVPFVLPDGWAWVFAAELCSVITDGDHQPPPKADQGVPFLVIGDVRTGGVDLTGASRFVPHGYFDALDWGKKPQVGDVLYTTVGSFGIPVPIKEVMHFCFQRHIALFRPAVADVQGFLHLALQSNHAFVQAEAGATGTAQKTVPLSVLRGLTIPLPPLAEQARIVAKVEELMSLCNQLEDKGRLEAEQHGRLVATLFDSLTSAESAHELAESWQRISAHFDLLLDRPEAVDVLEQTVLQLAVRGLLVPQDTADEPGVALMTRIHRTRKAKRRLTELDEADLASVEVVLPNSWTWTVVDQIAADEDNAITDGPFGANLKTEHYVEQTGFRVVRLQNIGHGYFREEHHSYIDEARFNLLSKHQLRAGDLVVAGLVDSSIRCCETPSTLGKAIVKADCYRFAVHPEVSTRYVALYLNSALAHAFAAVHHHGLTLTRIGLGNFRRIPIPIPPAKEQSRIVTRVEELRLLCAELRARLTQSMSVQSHLAEALLEEALA